MTPEGPRRGGESGRTDWAVFALAVVFMAAFMFCVISASDNSWPRVTRPGILVSLAGLVGTIAWLHFRTDDKDGPDEDEEGPS